jgi:protein arginine kinase
MELTSLKNRLVEWLRGGPQDDVVLSSRVRLARNVDGYMFVAHASEQQRARVEELLRNVLLTLDGVPPLNYVRVDRISELQRGLLTERHLIRSDAAEADWVRAVAFEDEERISAVINDEDHLRIQVIGGGLCVHESFERADEFDDRVAERVPYAFSPRYGYLTSSPTNTGTGLRASVMLHLPGLVMNHELERLADLARGFGVRLQGVYGEAYHGSGDIYQVSNVATLGPSEGEIVDTVAEVARRIVPMERKARRSLYESRRDAFVHRIDRALDLLGDAASISSQEALYFLSQVRMGLEMEVINRPSMEVVNDLFLLTLPAHLQTIEGKDLQSGARNELRAAYVRSRLSEN